MKIEDYGIIISTSRFGDSSYIVKILSFNHGAVKGLVRSSKKNNVSLQIGNFVHFTWGARLQEHLGFITLSLEKAYTMLNFSNYQKILSIASVCSLIDVLIPEREDASDILQKLQLYMEDMSELSWLQNYVMLELFILEKAGFGLSLDFCAVTGKTENLAYISPKSGCAVTREVGEEYKAKLFGIPSYFKTAPFKTPENPEVYVQEIIDGLEITRYFLAKHFFVNQLARIPQPALQFLDEILRSSRNETRENRSQQF